jgi:hypothetical protein
MSEPEGERIMSTVVLCREAAAVIGANRASTRRELTHDSLGRP